MGADVLEQGGLVVQPHLVLLLLTFLLQNGDDRPSAETRTAATRVSATIEPAAAARLTNREANIRTALRASSTTTDTQLPAARDS